MKMLFVNKRILYNKLLKHELKCEMELFNFIEHVDLMPEQHCFACNLKMSKTFYISKVKYRCNSCYAQQVESIINSNVESSLSTLKQLQLLVYFVQELNVKQTRNFSGICKPTVMKFNSAIRKLIYMHMKCIYFNKIGGDSHVVQVDETHFSVRKYNRGRIRKIVIFFGAIDSTTKELRIKKIKKKKKEILGKAIETFIKEGSEVHSDMFSSYLHYFKNNSLYKHKYVNHKNNFVDPNTKAHTQLIECVWSHLKKFIRRRQLKSKKDLKFYIKEFEFRRIHFDDDGFALFDVLYDIIFN